ncbi:flagellin N-terminal helical domain-containing protein [Hydrogenimonas cancrithermarum]|uniref:Flagellin n=1 Tax=Hydrogenimonas cancrithermarum TaxID=2993563 RepID=A0ABN6WV26_9BACT|nr:flagellin [Hydrogenimonas cancrithermarum]BDY12852.1 flagellin A [Hydrogenimonas cancrithermarum]BDY12969.1 flagellin A [Hydrogenimonas cancrithermarum]
MGFRINTNIGAMNAHRNALMTNKNLNTSLERLSSGLRINKAADDASGMAIADSLRAQAQGLGQAIRNANDGIGVVQTADGALDEYINIINTVRTKAIQAASDGQNADSRQAIQRDINRLLEEADNIAKTTSFNGLKLLDGTYTDKKFHIGAYAGETVSLSVSSVRTTEVGEITSVSGNDISTTSMVNGTDNVTETSKGYVINQGELTINGIDVTTALNQKNPNDLLSAKSVAAAISDETGLLATAKTEVQGGAIGGVTLDGDTDYVKINGINIGEVTITANDSDGAFAKAINDVSHLTGVKAELANGKIKLVAEDGRNISIDLGGTATTAATGLTDSTTTVTGTNDAANGLLTTDTGAVTIAEGALIINGHDMAGTYGSSVAGSAADELIAAIQAIDGLENSSIADGTNGGIITLVSNTGADINIAGSAAATYSFASGQEGIHNSSNKGTVSIVSDEKVVVGGNDPATFGFTAGGFTPEANDTSLDDVNVLSRIGAEMAIVITDAALKELDATRSDLGSVQNQLESTIRNISVTQVNVTAAESQIRDVDFAEESARFAKYNILAQSGSYALSQANAVQQNVLRLLQ